MNSAYVLKALHLTHPSGVAAAKKAGERFNEGVNRGAGSAPPFMTFRLCTPVYEQLGSTHMTCVDPPPPTGWLPPDVITRWGQGCQGVRAFGRQRVRREASVRHRIRLWRVVVAFAYFRLYRATAR